MTYNTSVSSVSKPLNIGVCTVFYKGVFIGETEGDVKLTCKFDRTKIMSDRSPNSPRSILKKASEIKVEAPLQDLAQEILYLIAPYDDFKIQGKEFGGLWTGEEDDGDVVLAEDGFLYELNVAGDASVKPTADTGSTNWTKLDPAVKKQYTIKNRTVDLSLYKGELVLIPEGALAEIGMVKFPNALADFDMDWPFKTEETRKTTAVFEATAAPNADLVVFGSVTA